MKQTSLPTYDELNEALSKTTLKLHPSQAHGLICGILCGNINTNSAWESLITGSKDPAATHEVLQALFAASLNELSEFLFEFQLVLPLDDEALSARAEALTLWSQGYLTGLKQAHVQIIDRQPGEMTDAIHDLIEIAKRNYEDVVASEE